MIALRILERREDTPRGDSCVTPAQGMLAHEIARAGGSTTRVLAKRLGISSSAVTQLVNGLEAEGILRRADDPNDGRRSRIELTELGAELYGRFDQARLAQAEALLDPLSDKEATELALLLTKITGERP